MGFELLVAVILNTDVLVMSPDCMVFFPQRLASSSLSLSLSFFFCL
jgi:hypothetical protein